MKNILTFLFVVFAAKQMTCQPFGQATYKFTGAYMSSAKRTFINSAGHLMAGYKPYSLNGQFNFCINKTGAGGGYGKGSNSLIGLYEVIKGNCGNPATDNIGNCNGVSIIETNIPPSINHPVTQWYALAGSWDEGVFFATFTPSGQSRVNKAYMFPFAQSGNGKPYIIESSVITSPSKTYYICGRWDQYIYVLHVDQDGNIIWQKFYTVSGSSVWFNPKSMIECSNTKEIVIVGGVVDGGITGIDGFFLKLNANGGVNLFKTYGMSGKNAHLCESFTDVKSVGNIPNNYYTISGEADPGYYLNTPWIIKLDNSGNIIWSTVVAPSTSGVSNSVPALTARINTSAQYEYYITAEDAVAGIQVLKVDDNGIPYTTGFNQFDYNAGFPNHSKPINVDFQNSGNNIALTTYGDADALAGDDFYLVRSYFSGHSGCDVLTNSCCYYNGPQTIYYPNIIVTNGTMNDCFVDILDMPYSTGPSQICISSSIPGGNNLRQAITNLESNNPENKAINIYPNPNNGVFSIEKTDNGIKSIVINDIQGRLIKTIELSEINTTVNLNYLDKGIYFVVSESDKGKLVQKVIIE